jgi:hypothetical protein
MGQQSENIFYLNSEYVGFIPRKTRLKFESVMGLNVEYENNAGCKAWLMGILAIVMLIGFIFLIREEWIYRTQGVPTVATVISCVRTTSNKSKITKITYQYSVSDVNYTDIDSDYSIFKTCDDFPIDISLPIEYLPNQPSESRIIQSHFFMLCAMPFMIIGLIWSSYESYINTSSYIRRKIVHYTLRRKGILIIGSIIEVVGVEKKVDADIVRITYKFKTPAGQTLYRAVQHHQKDFVGRQPPTKGKKVMVLYADDSAVMML